MPYIARSTFSIGCACLALALVILGPTRVLARVFVGQPHTSEAGSSALILIDFSRSIAPLTRADERALNALTEALGDAATTWPQPVKFSWAAITSSSLATLPFLTTGPCQPFEFDQKLIKSKTDIDRAGLRERLQGCVRDVTKASSVASNWTNYTDINGAIRLAAEGARDNGGQKILVILSDFKEDLAPGVQPVPVHLYGERVLLIHRPGRDDSRQTVEDYLSRIRKWKDSLISHGAKQVSDILVSGVTARRIAFNLDASQQRIGTAVSLLINLPGSAQPGSLTPVASAIWQLLRNWNPPITVTWIGAQGPAFSARWLPPVEFAPSLIKKPSTTTLDDLQVILEQSAAGMEKLNTSNDRTDLPGTIAMAWAADESEAQKILVLVSDFPENSVVSKVPQFTLDSATVVMVAAPSKLDFSNQTQYFERLDHWEHFFRNRSARHICRSQLVSLTSNVIISCVQKNSDTSNSTNNR